MRAYSQEFDPFDHNRLNAESARRLAESEARQRQMAEDRRHQEARMQAESDRLQQRFPTSQQQAQQQAQQYKAAPYYHGGGGGGYQTDWNAIGGNIADGARTVKDTFVSVVCAPLMYRTYRNWFARTGDKGLAFRKALMVGWMWKMWLFCLFALFLQNLYGGHWKMVNAQVHPLDPSYNDEVFYQWLWSWTCWLVATPMLPLMYVRLSEMSLLRQGWWYKTVRFIDRPFRWIPFPVMVQLVCAPVWVYVIVACARGTLNLHL